MNARTETQKLCLSCFLDIFISWNLHDAREPVTQSLANVKACDQFEARLDNSKGGLDSSGMLESWLQPLTRLFYSLLKWAWAHLVASQNEHSSVRVWATVKIPLEPWKRFIRYSERKKGTSQLGRSWISRKKKQFSSCQYINDTDPSIRVEIVSWSSWLNLCGETIVVLCTIIVHSGFLFILQKSMP